MQQERIDGLVMLIQSSALALGPLPQADFPLADKMLREEIDRSIDELVQAAQVQARDAVLAVLTEVLSSKYPHVLTSLYPMFAILCGDVEEGRFWGTMAPEFMP